MGDGPGPLLTLAAEVFALGADRAGAWAGAPPGRQAARSVATGWPWGFPCPRSECGPLLGGTDSQKLAVALAQPLVGFLCDLGLPRLEAAVSSFVNRS